MSSLQLHTITCFPIFALFFFSKITWNQVNDVFHLRVIFIFPSNIVLATPIEFSTYHFAFFFSMISICIVLFFLEINKVVCKMVPLWAYFCMFQVTEFLLWVWISLYGQMSCQNCEWNTNFWRNNGCLLLSSKEKIMMKKLAIENPKLIWLLQNNFAEEKNH